MIYKAINELFSMYCTACRRLWTRFSNKQPAQTSEAINDIAPKMRYVVVDLEWNQYPKWIRTPVSNEGVEMPHEIIQIGAISVDEDFNPIDAFSVGVRLQGRRKLSKHVAKVIQKTQADIDQGYDFVEAYAFFKQWSADADYFITWGRDDFRVLENNLAYYNLGELDASRWCDGQLIYAQQVRGDRVQTSLAKAASVLGVEDNLTHHDALNDAYITVGVCACLQIEEGIAEQKQQTSVTKAQTAIELKRENELFQHKKFRSASCEGDFETRMLCKQHCDAIQLRCPTCNQVMKPEPSRINNGERWMRLATCQTHGNHLVRFRIHNRAGGAFYWTQTIYSPDGELEHYYRQKVAQKQRRRKKTYAKPSAKKSPVLTSAAGGQR